MLIIQQINQYRLLNQWFQSALGQFVSQEFTQVLNSLASDVQGETLLQLGNCGNNDWLNTIHFNYQWVASPFQIKQINAIECSLNQLPFSRNSLDCVLAPLTLEPFGASLNLLDEIDRVLKPMGYIIFLSLNPWSYWGTAMKMGLLHCYDKNAVKMRTPYHLNRIFLQRGYRQVALKNFCYIPPVNNKKMIEKLIFLNEIGKMLWPFPSGFYCYIAQKYEFIMPNLSMDSVKQSMVSGLQPAHTSF